MQTTSAVPDRWADFLVLHSVKAILHIDEWGVPISFCQFVIRAAVVLRS